MNVSETSTSMRGMSVSFLKAGTAMAVDALHEFRLDIADMIPGAAAEHEDRGGCDASAVRRKRPALIAGEGRAPPRAGAGPRSCGRRAELRLGRRGLIRHRSRLGHRRPQVIGAGGSIDLGLQAAALLGARAVLGFLGAGLQRVLAHLAFQRGDAGFCAICASGVPGWFLMTSL